MITPEIVATIPFFAPLSAERRAQIAAHAADVRLQPGEWLIQEGETPAFFVLLSGSLDVTKTVAGVEQVINHYAPGDYFGELPLLLGSGAVAGLRAREALRVMRLGPTDFQRLVVGSPELNGELLRTMARRVGNLQRVAVTAPVATVRIIGDRRDPTSRNLRDFLARNQIVFEWHDPDDDAAQSRLASAGTQVGAMPIVMFSDDSILPAPTPRAVAERLRLQTSPSESV